MPLFYVYALIDPRTADIFYVGKGSGRRLQNHEVEARRGVRSSKCDRIRAIWADGHQVGREIVSRHEDENEALDAEYEMIESIGLSALTNVLPGGRLGTEAYMARASERTKRVLRKGLVDLAPKFAFAMKAKAVTGGFGAYVNGRWLEFSGAYEALFRDMVRAVGVDDAKEIMAPHGVNIV